MDLELFFKLVSVGMLFLIYIRVDTIYMMARKNWEKDEDEDVVK
jgi:hypothetical protein